jgi:hypothetical protein
MTDDMLLIKEIASQLRRAMEFADFSDCPSNLAGFPSQCCDHAGSLLMILFRECGIEGFEMLRGQHPNCGRDQWHVWIQRGNVVVDITADQFGGQHQSVIVGESLWHAEFCVEKCRSDRVEESMTRSSRPVH